MMNRIKCRYDKMPITKKIMLLYAMFFTFTIISISVILLLTTKSMGIGITYTTLKNNADNIENYIISGQRIDSDAIQSIIGNSYTEYIIENTTDKEVFVSDMFAFDKENDEPLKRSELPENIENEFELRERRYNGYESLFDNSGYMLYTRKGHEFLSVCNEFEYDGTTYSVRLFKATASNAVYVKYIAMRLFYADILGIFIACMLGLYVSYVLLKPLRKIRETAERISAEDLSRRIEIDGPDDELKDLSITFNSMIDRLEKSFEQQSRFVSDASHELRTPISVIKGYANLINRWGKDDPEILQEAVNNILEETDHMSVMIKNLLFLAKSDQKRNQVQKQPMSLNEAVRDISKDLMVTDERINVVTDICDEELIINGDYDLIKQMLWIYTENAVKYSGEKKTITYRVYKEGSYVCVSVKDNGCGIKDEDLPHIFDRFYRADKSRNKEIPGTGLGLSIAKWIVDIHNGEVKVESTVGVGTEFINKFKVDD